MTSRLIALSLCLFLAGCATTKNASPEPDPELTTTVQADLPKGEGDSIDEHLYIPDSDEDETGISGDQKPAYENVWRKVVDNFSLPSCDSHEESLMWANWYADHAEYMARVMKRAKPWIYFIAEELETRKLPGELALLPIVESAYDPFAYSSGRALGTWQFIASTGKHYGLKQDWWYDGRRDVWSSTHAALDYLEHLNNKFDGDWMLALAGYNSGENRVEREMKKNLKNGKPTDFWSIRLPRETKGYVPKLLGLTCLFQNPDKYGFAFPKAPNHPVISVVEMETQSDLVLISQLSGVSIDVLFSLNPGFSRWATSPDGPWHVILPIEGAQKLQQYLQSDPTPTLMKWDQVLVESGDTLSSLANRHHVPVSVLRSTNNLKSDTIRVGQKLRLPRDEQLLVDPLYVAAANELQKLQSGLIASERITHKVRPGESLSVIAKRYKVSVRELQAWNNISDPRKLRAGKTLTLFQSPAPAAPAVRSGTIKHTVRSGDSLWSIARHYNVRVSDLMRWNDLSKNAVIQPGQSIKINL
ncbi:MAG TPA: LysM peptidoglycan-binding domain-containing protein [Xanthomonadales bacterium]